jgi:urease accessory protein
VIARARLAVEAGPGACRITCLRSDGPFVLRPTPGGVYLVGAAAGPIGGDDLGLEVDVGPGAELTLRTVAAAVVLPGPGPSRLEIVARVGEGGSLWWLPEPTVAATGAVHRVQARVEVGAGARLLWRDEIVLGRHGEEGGSVSARLSVDVAGRPLLRHRIDAGADHPEWASAAVGGGARCAGSLVAVDPAWTAAGGSPPGPSVLQPGAAVLLPLSGPAVHVVALAQDARTLSRLLDAGQAALSARPVAPAYR